MLNGILEAAGGLGLFLLGMSVMTEGLRAMADERLKAVLARTTKGPVSGVCTGAVTTALLQSSSATTVAAVGFVHAGLLTFSQALGIIFGANIGTTMTGWLVALLGLKLQLGKIVLPVILGGMLLRLIGHGRTRATGTALAGFGLIFVGIDVLQSGMAGFQGLVTPDSFPPDTLSGRLLLVLIGVAITIVTQSSSAGVAAALAAVHSQTITLNQAAAMVIGMDFGTTVTAAMATIGGNVQARRTGLAHVVYNAMTAAGALVLLSPFLTAVEAILPTASTSYPELVLVGFHTFFNTLGVLFILPFTGHFARLITRLFPERGSTLTQHLDRSLLGSPDLALKAVRSTLQSVTAAVFAELVRRIDDPASPPDQQSRIDAEQALGQTRDYLQLLRIEGQHPEWLDRCLGCVHVLDHLRRVLVRSGNERRLKHVRSDADLSAMTDEMLSSVEILLSAGVSASPDEVARLREINTLLKQRIRTYRLTAMRLAAEGKLDTQTALRRMDTARWLRRLTHHAMRVAKHSQGKSPAQVEKTSAQPTETS